MPNSPVRKLKESARRLLVCEAASRKPAAANHSGYLVCEKLRGPLGKLLGVGGFRSLLSRALALAGAEVPSLRTVEVNADGSLKGLDELQANIDSRAFAEGEVVLVSQLIGLLLTFIGGTLTAQLLNDIWPNMDGLDF